MTASDESAQSSTSTLQQQRMSLTKRNTLIDMQRTNVIKVNADHEFPKSATLIVPVSSETLEAVKPSE